MHLLTIRGAIFYVSPSAQMIKISPEWLAYIWEESVSDPQIEVGRIGSVVCTVNRFFQAILLRERRVSVPLKNRFSVLTGDGSPGELEKSQCSGHTQTR